MEASVLENLACKNDALNYSPSEMKRRKPGKKTYKPHLATKVRWALEDLMERTIAAQRRMRRAMERLEEIRAIPHIDREVLVAVGRLEHEMFGLALDVSEMERIMAQTMAECRPKDGRSLKGKAALGTGRASDIDI